MQLLMARSVNRGRHEGVVNLKQSETDFARVRGTHQELVTRVHDLFAERI